MGDLSNSTGGDAPPHTGNPGSSSGAGLGGDVPPSSNSGAASSSGPGNVVSDTRGGCNGDGGGDDDPRQGGSKLLAGSAADTGWHSSTPTLSGSPELERETFKYQWLAGVPISVGSHGFLQKSVPPPAAEIC